MQLTSNDQVGTCTDYANAGWSGPQWLVFNGTMHEKASLHGEARLDTLFGVLLDGDGDYVSFEPEAASSYSNRFDYAAQGTFGVSLWFTRRDCAIPGRYEALYSHSQVDSCNSSPEECWTDPANSNIHVLIGCAANGVHSTLAGDILRVILVDDVQVGLTVL